MVCQIGVRGLADAHVHRGLRCHAGTQSTVALRAADDDLRGIAAARQFVDKTLRTGGQRNERHTHVFKMALQAGCHHPTVPRAPTDGTHHAARASAGLLGTGHQVQHLIGHRVVALAQVARACRHR